MIAWRSRSADAFVVLLFIAGVLCMTRAVAGCHGPAAAGAEAAYGASLLRCVDEAKSLAESKACRARVDAEWGVDGGAK